MALSIFFLPTEVIALFLSGIYGMTRLRQQLSFPYSWIVDGLIAILVQSKLSSKKKKQQQLYLSIVPWWGICTSIVSQGWPKIVDYLGFGNNYILKILIHGGPLGRGCKKFVEVLVAIVLSHYLLTKASSSTSSSLSSSSSSSLFTTILTTITTSIFGCKNNINLVQLQLPGIWEWMGILVFSAAVNIVLHTWSSLTQSKGNHSGVNDMVAPTSHRSLSWSEHFQIFLLAMMNGFCEEMTSRWFWRNEFAIYYHYNNNNDNNNNNDHIDINNSNAVGIDVGDNIALNDYHNYHYIHHVNDDKTKLYSNLAQALLFGIWHYHGIPSGWIGVGLTFAYGFIMGLLQDYYDGSLFIPIIVHGIADYYIFAVIARQQLQKNDSTLQRQQQQTFGGTKSKTS